MTTSTVNELDELLYKQVELMSELQDNMNEVLTLVNDIKQGSTVTTKLHTKGKLR